MYELKRNPAWTDRILYYSKEDKLELKSYDSNNLVNLSDHRPVFAQFLLSIDLSPDETSEQDAGAEDGLSLSAGGNVASQKGTSKKE